MDSHDEVFRNKVINKWKSRHPPPETADSPKLQLGDPPKLENADVPMHRKRSPSPETCQKKLYTVPRGPPSLAVPLDSDVKKARSEPQTQKNKKRKLKKKLRKQQLKAEASIQFTYKPTTSD